RARSAWSRRRRSARMRPATAATAIQTAAARTAAEATARAALVMWGGAGSGAGVADCRSESRIWRSSGARAWYTPAWSSVSPTAIQVRPAADQVHAVPRWWSPISLTAQVRHFPSRDAGWYRTREKPSRCRTVLGSAHGSLLSPGEVQISKEKKGSGRQLETPAPAPALPADARKPCGRPQAAGARKLNTGGPGSIKTAVSETESTGRGVLMRPKATWPAARSQNKMP